MPRYDPHPASLGGVAIPTHDFNEFIHSLRTIRLRQMPRGAETVLSAGAAGQWYLDWIAANYPGIRRHIAVEQFQPRPDPLPAGVEWLQCSMTDLSAVESNAVDLLFAGQVIEHLPLGGVSAFLAEAWRVLKIGGSLIVDSPNRATVQPLGWNHPDHTVEFTVDEWRRMLDLAGFASYNTFGVWLLRDNWSDSLLPLEINIGGSFWPYGRRIAEAERNPENSFIWWNESNKTRTPPDAARLRIEEESVAATAGPRPR